MATASYKYEPDYAVPPGWILEERLDTRQMSQAEFARRCGRSPKLISDIIAGKSAIQPEDRDPVPEGAGRGCAHLARHRLRLPASSLFSSESSLINRVLASFYCVGDLTP